MAVGSPLRLIDAILKRGVGGLTVVCNDLAAGQGRGQARGGGPGEAGDRLAYRSQSDRPEEDDGRGARDRAGAAGDAGREDPGGGYGLGGVFHGDRAGTLVEEGKQIIEVDGRPFILEKPIRGDFALIACHHADYVGNLGYVLTAHNFNLIMALAGEVVIAGSRAHPARGHDPPDVVKTPGFVVDYLLGRAA